MSTPTCPSCKAKFSFDNATRTCKVCGLPDEIAVLGGKMIARWRRKSGVALNSKQRHPSSRHKRRKTHGRP